jgi:hypothetical protein
MKEQATRVSAKRAGAAMFFQDIDGNVGWNEDKVPLG